MSENPIKIRPTLVDMEIGDSCSFPVRQLRSVRATASELGMILDRTYKTSVNKIDRLINVIRTA